MKLIEYFQEVVVEAGTYELHPHPTLVISFDKPTTFCFKNQDWSATSYFTYIRGHQQKASFGRRLTTASMMYLPWKPLR